MALTERYSNVGGSGSEDGTSESDAWDIADVLKATSVAAGGQRVNHKGDWSPGATNVTFDLVATDLLPCLIQGYVTTPQDLEGVPPDGTEPMILLDDNYHVDLGSNRYTTFRNMGFNGNTNGAFVRNTWSQKFEYCSIENESTASGARLVTLVAATCSFDTCYLAMSTTASGAYYFNFSSDYFCVFTYTKEPIPTQLCPGLDYILIGF